MRRDIYHTKQKDIIINCMKNINGEFTIQDVYLKLGKNIGLTTIYRLVNVLVDEGILHKVLKNHRVAYYEYLEKCDKDNHFFLKCDLCGAMEHVDCDCINELFSHILKKHKFQASHDQIIIKGYCQNCFRGDDNLF